MCTKILAEGMGSERLTETSGDRHKEREAPETKRRRVKVNNVLAYTPRPLLTSSRSKLSK